MHHLQEPGRYLAFIVPGRHAKVPTWVGIAATVRATPAAVCGVRVIVPLAAGPRPASALAVTVITPFASVATPETYFVAVVPSPQPQPLAVGAVPAGAVW